jgi:hypothetical protein
MHLGLEQAVLLWYMCEQQVAAFSCQIKYVVTLSICMGRGSLVSVATRYGLDGLGIEFQ